MKAIFTGTPRAGKMIPDNRVDLEMYLLENEGISQIIQFSPEAKTSEKMKMYNFLFGPLMDIAVKAFTHMGYEGMDNVKARYKLQAEYAKADMIGPNGVESYLLDLSGMDKARLLKFIQDIIFFLESHGFNTPDSSQYKMMKLTGKSFSSTKYKKTQP